MVKVKYILIWKFIFLFFVSSSLFAAGGKISGYVFNDDKNNGVYHDTDRNQQKDSSETGTLQQNFVKLCKGNTWIKTYEINSSNTEGKYEFYTTTDETYTLIKDDSNTSDCTTSGNPSGWSSSTSNYIFVKMSGIDETNQNFGSFEDNTQPLSLEDRKRAYLFQNKPSDVYTLDLVTGELIEIGSNITPADKSHHVNGLGYNKKDGYLWGSTPIKRGFISRVGKDSSGNWVETHYGPIKGLTIFSYTGDIDDNGILYLKAYSNITGGDWINGHDLFVIDLDPNSPTYLTQIHSFDFKYKDTGNSVSLKSTDWAINPQDEMLYTVNNGGIKRDSSGNIYDPGTHYLWRINPKNGRVENLGDTRISNSISGGLYMRGGSTANLPKDGIHNKIVGSRTFGGSFFTGDGFYYLYDNGPGRKTGEVFRINITNPSSIDPIAVPFSKPRKTSLNDGVMFADNKIYLDFGDAPDNSTASVGDNTAAGNYRTMLSDDGPRHKIPQNITVYLGSKKPTHEDDAKPTLKADGDDGDDGVSLDGKTLQGADIVAGSTITLDINTSGAGDLHAWIDWNNDGNFSDKEQIADFEDGSSGHIILSNIKVPNNVTSSTSICARFRYTSDPTLIKATGPAKDGEVEDYMINIASGNKFGVWDTNLSITNQIIRTKIVNQDINLTIASLDTNNSKFMTSSYKYVKAAIFADTQKLTNWKDVNLTDTNSTDVMFGKINEAHRVAYVRVKYGDANMTKDLKDTNLSEKFAIRPDRFEIGVLSSPLVAGKEFDLNIAAVGIDGVATSNYDETSTSYKISLDEEQNLTCLTGDLNMSASSKFSDGSFGVKATYSEVGKVVASITDKGFASIDINDTSASQRLISSASSPPIVFNAANFDVKWDFVNRAQIANMTYFSSMPNAMGMGARLDIRLQARNFLGANLENYTASCYASDIVTRVNFNILGTDGSIYTPTWSVDINGEILVSLNPLIITGGVANGGIVASTFKNRFSDAGSGQANTSVHINLRRNQRVASEPVNFAIIDVNATDINITYENRYDSSSLSTYESSHGTKESSYGSAYDYRDGGNYVNKDDLNGSAFGFSDASDTAGLDNANFYYGRVHVPDYQAVGVDFNATLFYEVYCFNCNPVVSPKIANARESVDSVYWYILTPADFDNLGVGVTNPVYSRGGVGNIANVPMARRDVITLQANRTPYTDRIIYQTDSWLLYNRFRNVTDHSFLIEHHSPITTWSGKGKEGERIDSDGSRRKSQKMDW